MRHGCLRIVNLAIILACGAACNKPAPPPFDDWIPPQAYREPVSGSKNAWDHYALAARSAVKKGEEWRFRVSFTEGMLAQMERDLPPEIGAVMAASKMPCEFAFTPKIPFSPDLHHQGWRLIANAMQYRLKRHLENNEFDQAIDVALAGTRFGFDICGGCSADASLGLWIVDHLRAPLLERLGEFGAGQLSRLSKGVEAALARKPDLSVTIRHERLQFLAGVQYIQDCYQDRAFQQLESELGLDAREAVKFLERLAKDDDAARQAYFRGFAKEAEDEVAIITAAYSIPPSERGEWKEPDEDAYRPWKRFAKHYFGTGKVLVRMNDRALTLSRLFILESRLLAIFKATRQVPADLSAFPKDLATDPYTGRPFVYRASSTDYRLYSVGQDQKDDGGEADVSGNRRDVWLAIGGR
ncbi:MAG: hypothetical protein HONBIEJF_02128 [Fimbriimonadaceae bacterium]|nr:hypothetical protein [Fimbriimonadaceae bacterium]